LNARWAGFPDLTLQERVLVAPAIALMFVLGIYPQLLLGFVNSTVVEMVKHLRF
jgi:NADH-quinone oxidoreductase subunit M